MIQIFLLKIAAQAPWWQGKGKNKRKKKVKGEGERDLVRSRKINLQSHVEELERARTTTGIHAEMQCVRYDVQTQKKGK